MPWIISVFDNKDFVTLNQTTAPLSSESCLRAQWVPNLSDNTTSMEKQIFLLTLLSESIHLEEELYLFFSAQISMRYFLPVESYKSAFSKLIHRSVKNVVCLNPK